MTRAAAAWPSWLAVALALIGSVAQAQDAAPEDEPPSGAPEWHWIQVLASPRIGQRLTAIAVHPSRPEEVWVGSQSGVVLRSEDGGTTWIELEPDALTATARTTPAPEANGSCRECGDDVVFLQRIPYRGPPYSVPAVNPADIRPWFDFLEPSTSIFGTPRLADPVPRRTLLTQAVETRDTEPVSRVTVCPTNYFPLIVATENEVLGSNDGGYTWVRLLRFPGDVETPQVACDPSTPHHLVVATDAGLWESDDGGITLSPALSGWPRHSAAAVQFTDDGTLFIGSEEELFVRRGRHEEPERVYPVFESSETIPWEPIDWIEPDGDEVWLATRDGLRRSFDGGRRFTQVAPNLLARQAIGQVIRGQGETGTPRLAAIVRDCPAGADTPNAPGCRATHVLSTDDGGETWHPFFSGITRRSIQQMAYAGGRWFVLTGGELWVTARAEPGAVAQETVDWARRRLGRTPPMRAVVEAALDRVDLNREQIDSMLDRAAARSWLPDQVSLNFEYDAVERDVRALDAPPAGPSAGLLQDARAQGAASRWSLFVYVRWNLEDVGGWDPAQLERTRTHLYAIRRRIGFLIEDAWHERRLHLRRLARGFADPYQAEVLRQRVGVLEALMEFWLDGELDALAPAEMTRRRR